MNIDYKELLESFKFEELMLNIEDEKLIEALYDIPFEDGNNMIPLVFALHVIRSSNDNKIIALYCSVVSVLMHLHYSNDDNDGYKLGLFYAQKAIAYDDSIIYKQRILNLYSILLPEEVLDPCVGKEICQDILKLNPEDETALAYYKIHKKLWMR